MLQQFCSAEPALPFRCAFLWDLYLEVQVGYWTSRPYHSNPAVQALLPRARKCMQHCNLTCDMCEVVFVALLGGPDILDSIRVVLVVSIVFFAAFVVAFLVLVGSVCVGLGVRDGGRRSPSSLSSLLLLRLLLFVLLLLLLGFNMCCSLW